MDETLRNELFEFLRIPSVSADPEHKDDVHRAAEWVRDFIVRAGGDAAIEATDGLPLVIGEIRASVADAPTVLVYGHFDVQPPDPLDSWDTPPFEPTVVGEWLVARGVADDKGQLYLLLRAAADLASEGRLPVHVRVACDGEEEVLGTSIVDFLAQDTGPADVCVMFDGPMPARGVPAFSMGLRGIAYFHVRVRTGKSDLHSGIFGSAALNAIHALIQTLSSVIPNNGRLPVGLQAGINRPADDEIADWSKLQPGSEVLREHGARPADATAADNFYMRTFVDPSIEINGIAGGSPRLLKTVLPVVAEANVSMRLAPGQDPRTITAEFERLLRESAPTNADVDIDLWSQTPAAFQSPDSRAVQLGLDAFERALGVRPILVRLGGSAPVLPALVERGIPTIHAGFDVPGGNAHAPNERLLLEYLDLGLNAARELYISLGDLR